MNIIQIEAAAPGWVATFQGNGEILECRVAFWCIYTHGESGDNVAGCFEEGTDFVLPANEAANFISLQYNVV